MANSAPYARGGYAAVLRRQIAAADKQPNSICLSAWDLAKPYAHLGQREHTLELLEEELQFRDPSLLEVQNDPAFDFLHDDERYRSLIKIIGLPPAW